MTSNVDFKKGQFKIKNDCKELFAILSTEKKAKKFAKGKEVKKLHVIGHGVYA